MDRKRAIASVEQVRAPLPPVLAWRGASENRAAPPGSNWITPVEASSFEESPSYEETLAFVEKLVAASPLLRTECFGVTSEGRELHAVTASRGDGRDRPILFVQGGLHPGEIDGKDAGLMLLRDIVTGDRGHLLDGADLILVPVFNADGHERSSHFNRPNQRGPGSQGWRTTARNINLNRDYLKADAPEMRAMIAFLNRSSPTLCLDIHVTDGADYQYDITYSFNGLNGRYAQSPAIGRWLDRVFRPAADHALTHAGHIPGPMVLALDERNPFSGIVEVAAGPRFSQGYGDMRRLPTVLIENHSLKPHRQRVLGTHVLIEAAMLLLAAEGQSLKAAIAGDRRSRPSSMTTTWKTAPEAVAQVDFKGVEFETFASPVSGRDEIRWLGRPRDALTKVYAQVPDRMITLPRAWWIPVARPEVIERLHIHGIETQVQECMQTRTLEMFRLVGSVLEPPYEGRVPLRLESAERVLRQETFPAGSVRVPADQPLGLLAAALLEPESPDSLLAWGFFPDIFQRTEYMEGYVIEPLARRMVETDPELGPAFEKKLTCDPDFAADPERRLAWFYERSAYYDERYLLYPIARELCE